MHTLMLACEVLRPELEMLTARMQDPPAIEFLDQKLHDCPEKLRGVFQEHIAAFEQQSGGPLTILCGYGLCGRALCGVYATRATLVFPRLHDCIQILLGLEPRQALQVASRDGSTLWMSPGWLRCHMIPYHLEEVPRRFAAYEQKYGTAKATRLMAAEKRMLENYTQACHIRWAEMGITFVPDARKIAQSTSLPYTERNGSSAYLAELLRGGEDPARFVRLVPGQTIDMDVEGLICPVWRS